MGKQLLNSLFDHYSHEKNFSGVGYVKKGAELVFAQSCGYAHRGFQVLNSVDTMPQPPL